MVMAPISHDASAHIIEQIAAYTLWVVERQTDKILGGEIVGVEYCDLSPFGVICAKSLPRKASPCLLFLPRP